MRVGPPGGLYRSRRDWIGEYLNSSVMFMAETEARAELAIPSGPVVPATRKPKTTTRQIETTNNQARKTVAGVRARIFEHAVNSARCGNVCLF